MLQSSSSFTIVYEDRVNELQTDCYVSSAIGPSAERSAFKAVWDTGATNSVVSERVVTSLDLISAGLAEVFQVNDPHPYLANIYLANIMLSNGIEFQDVSVTSSALSEDDADVLTGMDIISHGDFAITSSPNGLTKFSFRFPSEADIDFVRNSRT